MVLSSASPVLVRPLFFLLLNLCTDPRLPVDIYWLGLDENVNNAVSYPGKSRIREAMAMTVAMGGNTIRSHTLGVRCVVQFFPSFAAFKLIFLLSSAPDTRRPSGRLPTTRTRLLCVSLSFSCAFS